MLVCCSGSATVLSSSSILVRVEMSPSVVVVVKYVLVVVVFLGIGDLGVSVTLDKAAIQTAKSFAEM